MSREIKFRAWDDKNKLMLDDCYIDCYDGSVYEVPLETYNTPHTEIERANYDIMQYTGLKDKNGKEIYEGDQLNVKLNTEKVVTDSVYWNDYGWRWNSYALKEVIHESKIMGNIHENKELLK